MSTQEVRSTTDHFTIYPNPASTQITISYQSGDKEIRAEIIDTKGSLISTKNLKSSNGNYNEKINIEGLPYGMYFIKLNGSKKSMTKAFIKK